jgi:hypothetical protein
MPEIFCYYVFKIRKKMSFVGLAKEVPTTRLLGCLRPVYCSNPKGKLLGLPSVSASRDNF